MGADDPHNHFRAAENQMPRLMSEALSLRCGVSTGEPLVLAVSGGGDSMGMLYGVTRIEGTDPKKIVVAHINHGLRGVESQFDQDCVMHACLALGIRFVAQHAQVAGAQDSRGMSVEMIGRKLRHAALARICREVGVHRVCLAHTADDQVEHFLLRLFRGSGSAGLRGMRWASRSPADPQVRLLRPLLGVTRSQLRAFLTSIGGNFRDDSSNNDRSIPRNRIRHEVLPMLRQVAGPSLDHMIRRSMDLIGAEGTFAESMATLWGLNPDHSSLDSQHTAIQRIAIRDQLISIGVEPDFRIIEALRRPGKRSVAVAGGQWVSKTELGSLSFSRAARVIDPSTAAIENQLIKVTPTGQTGSVELPGRARIEWRRWGQIPSQMPNPDTEALFDASRLDGGITFRHWRPGDRFRPLGMLGTAKLQDCFVNRKIPRQKRHELWIGEDSNAQIFWIEGFPPSENHRVRSDTQAALGIRCIRETT